MSTLSTKSVLLIAFHFPPMRGSSGLQRTLSFARHLPDHGWHPVVLAPHQMAYESIDPSQMDLLPDGLIVERSFCLDTARHLSFCGRYPDFLARPDRWSSWIPAALFAGMRSIRKYRPSVLWSTYPVATSHIIGRVLSQWTGLPWIADFRDPMVEQNPRTGQYAPPDSRVRNARLRIEQACVRRASALVFCTDWARDICEQRHCDLPVTRCHIISNGYEELSFRKAEALLKTSPCDVSTGPFRLLHSGTIYPTPDRDPRPFFDAIAALKKKNGLSASSLRITLRATGHDEYFEPLLKERNINDIVELASPLPYIEALAEMISADGLLLLQGYTSNPAVPAKLYEYLRARTPILALVDPAGSTAKILSDVGTAAQVSIENSNAIEMALKKFLRMPKAQHYSSSSTAEIVSYSRSVLTKKLAALFDAVSN